MYPPLDQPPPPPPSHLAPHLIARPRFDLGWVLEKGFGAYLKNLPAFLVMALVIYSPLILYAVVVDHPMASAESTDELASKIIMFSLVTGVGSFLLSQVLASAVVYAVVEQLAGRHAPIGRCLTVGLSRMLPTLAVALLAGLAAGLAAILLIVPGLIVMCMYYVAVPASVVERPGIGGALSRSAELTKGHRWSVLVLFLVMMGVGMVLGLGLESVLIDKVAMGSVEVVKPDDWRLYVMLQVGIQLFAGALGATLSATTYVALRNSKEGIGADELSKVFA